MLVHIKEVMKYAKNNHKAIGAFNVHGIESILGVAQGVLCANSPAIIQVSESTIEYIGLKPITHLVATVAKNVAANVPIALHLDHGKSLKSVLECIRAGFTSVHIDASDLPLDENIYLTKRVVEIAHAKNVWVQGEVGAMIGGHGQQGGKLKGIPIADPADVIRFVRETGVDTVAAAVGTAHGIYANETINLEVLKRIKSKVKIPFVLHGASGLSESMIRKGIAAGVNIINVGSDIKVAFSSTLIKTCMNNKKETDPRKLLAPTIMAVKDVVCQRIGLFGTKKSQ